MTVYYLSRTGRNVEWKEWKYHSGCSLSQMAENEASKVLGPSNRWSRNGVTLGDIANASMLADRELAGYAVRCFSRKDLVCSEKGG